jgi:glutathione S-transferase
MNAVIAITVLALGQYFFFGALVARARRTYNVQAPAMSGHEVFERMQRVHTNTLERLVLFLPLLWLAAQAWQPLWIAPLGLVYLAGRILYWRGYVKNPPKRSFGNILTMASVGILLIATIAGLVQRTLASMP